MLTDPGAVSLLDLLLQLVGCSSSLRLLVSLGSAWLLLAPGAGARPWALG